MNTAEVEYFASALEVAGVLAIVKCVQRCDAFLKMSNDDWPRCATVC